jgi:hypothetical protein
MSAEHTAERKPGDVRRRVLRQHDFESRDDDRG